MPHAVACRHPPAVRREKQNRDGAKDAQKLQLRTARARWTRKSNLQINHGAHGAHGDLFFKNQEISVRSVRSGVKAFALKSCLALLALSRFAADLQSESTKSPMAMSCFDTASTPALVSDAARNFGSAIAVAPRKTPCPSAALPVMVKAMEKSVAPAAQVSSPSPARFLCFATPMLSTLGMAGPPMKTAPVTGEAPTLIAPPPMRPPGVRLPSSAVMPFV